MNVELPTSSLGAAELERVAIVKRHMGGGAAGIAPLLEMLDDPAWTVRRHVIAALASSGDRAVRPLCDVLRTRRDSEARIAAAVDALVSSSGSALESVASLASDSDPAVVSDVAQILGRRGEPGSVPVLVDLLGHVDDNVAVAAMEALGRIGGRAAVESLLTVLESGSFFRTFSAIDVLGRTGDARAIQPLAHLLGDSTYVLEAAKALGRCGERGAVAPLVTLLARPSDSHVRAGALALADLLRRHQERYGTAASVEREITSRADAESVSRHLLHSLLGSDPAEQQAICTLFGLLGGEETVPSLIGFLDGPSELAQSATDALRRRSRGMDGSLAGALFGAPSSRRMLLLPLLGRASSADAVAVCLDDPDPAVRALACETLGRLGNTQALPRLFRFIGEANPRVSQAAIAAIQSLGTERTEELALAAAHSEDAGVRRAALRILGYFGFVSALETPQAAAHGDDPAAREIAIVGLASLDDPRAVDTILGISKGPHPRSRAAAMRALGACSTSDARVISYLLRGFDDPDPWVRYYAVQSIGKRRFTRGVTAVSAKLDDPAGHVRVAAVEALSHFEGEEANVALGRASDSADPDVARAALMGLGIEGLPESLPRLIAAARSDDASTRLVAVSALAHYRDEAAIDALVTAAVDRDEGVRNAAIGFLAGRGGADITRRLVALLRSPPGDERVLTALRVPASGRVAGLRAALETADDDLAAMLVSVLVRMGRPDSLECLFDAFTSTNASARRATASALGALGTVEAREALRAAARRDPDPEVRRISALVLD